MEDDSRLQDFGSASVPNFHDVWGLEPFIHQVGGHSPLFCLDSSTVCKPYEEREHSFYRNMPDCLKPFTPQFKGSMRVKIVEDTDGYITLTGYPPNSFCNVHSIDTNDRPKMILKRCGSIEIESESQEVKDQYFTDEKISEEKLYNPWALKCHRDNLKKMGITLYRNPALLTDSDMTPITTFQEYILLENLTNKYKHPCVLDLKLGTRQHGDNASAAKKLSKATKVANTTSGVLGLRLGGMQVYQVSLGRYICRSKHFGRVLSVDGIKNALKQFFSNGLLVRRDVIRELLTKLTELHSLLSELDSFRFFTSSLLVTYDGSSSYQWSQNPAPRTSSSTSSIMSVSEDFAKLNTDLRQRHRSVTDMTSGKCEASEIVDLRLIDFAHSTHRGLLDSCVHDGPDQGLLFGLESFMKMITEIEQEDVPHQPDEIS